jgi:hypothetical protein
MAVRVYRRRFRVRSGVHGSKTASVMNQWDEDHLYCSTRSFEDGDERHFCGTCGRRTLVGFSPIRHDDSD